MSQLTSVKPSTYLDLSRLQVAYDRVAEAVKAKEIPSGVLAVANRDEIIRCEAFCSDGTINTDSIFMIGSITKPIVATAIMQLVEAGKIVLSEPITRYIPEFAQPGKPPISTFQILNHTAGLEENAWTDALGTARMPAAVYFQGICRSNLHFEPGERFRYNSLTFVLLAEMITRLSGMPYPDYLQKYIFEPLGMVDTSFDPRYKEGERAAPVHNIDPDVLDYIVSLQVPGGGLWSTATDLVRFGQTYLKGGRHGDHHLLSPSFINLMTQDHTAGLLEYKEGRKNEIHYGLGWGKTGLMAGHPASTSAYGHSGITGTNLLVDPEWDLVFVFLSNHWGADIYVSTCVQQAVYSALRKS